MDQRQPGTPAVLAFAPTQKSQDNSGLIDQVGHALVAMLREAANISNENVDRAMTIAHKLSVQLRAAEDRIGQLEGRGRTSSESRHSRRALARYNQERD